ncbi:MAG: AmmeMemoRadiSam system radical SAM enzyme [Sedimentisphaerales bacterium]|nr:AmmeMemoRadiSam system radical SAM enzyme [Sedimentisphaerales bacterium]
MEAETLKPAALWNKANNSNIRCCLCNWRCLISDGKLGHCRVRKNIGGQLYSLNYDKVCAATPDPIEKKPLFHFLPGTRSFSIAAPGCNFRCEFCQNWQISQMTLETSHLDGKAVPPSQIVQTAIRSKCASIAYTYTEPTIFMELAADCGKLAKHHGLANVFVSNGYMTIEAIDFAKDWLNAINIDLKAFSEGYYKKLCKAKLKPVLQTIRHIAKNTNIWMELTTLIVPGENDSSDELKRLAEFIAKDAGVDVPWHISRFYPNYHFLTSEATPSDTLQRAYEIGKAAGLRYVYMGNVPGVREENTFCHHCGEMLIERIGYTISTNKIRNSKCPMCETAIAGQF